MNIHLKNYVSKQMTDASTFVLKYMPITLSVDQIYEGLIEEPHVIRAFADATQYLPPAAMTKRVDVRYGDIELKLMLRFQPTEKHNVFLMPKYDLKVNSQSDLGQALALPVRLAHEWEMLATVWDKLSMSASDPAILSLLFPWLQEMFKMFDLSMLPSIPSLKSERIQIEREVRKIMAGRVPNRFPRLTARLNTVCLSGRALFSQFRMLNATFDVTQLTAASVSVERIGISLPEWLNRHLDEVVTDWAEDELDRINLKIEGTEFVQRRAAE